MATQELTLHLSEELVERIEQAAQRGKQPRDSIIAEILNISLPPLRHHAAPPMQELVAKLEGKTETELHNIAETRLTEPDQRRLSELLAYNRERSLTKAEEQEIEALLDTVQSVASDSAAARWLLRQNETLNR